MQLWPTFSTDLLNFIEQVGKFGAYLKLAYSNRVGWNKYYLKKMSFLQNFLQRYMPTVKAEEEELIDPQKILRVSKNCYIIFVPNN